MILLFKDKKQENKGKTGMNWTYALNFLFHDCQYQCGTHVSVKKTKRSAAVHAIGFSRLMIMNSSRQRTKLLIYRLILTAIKARFLTQFISLQEKSSVRDQCTLGKKWLLRRDLLRSKKPADQTINPIACTRDWRDQLTATNWVDIRSYEINFVSFASNLRRKKRNEKCTFLPLKLLSKLWSSIKKAKSIKSSIF